MTSKVWYKTFSVLALIVLVMSSVAPAHAVAAPAAGKSSPAKPAAAAGIVEVVYPLKADVSPALRDITPKPVVAGATRQMPAFNLPKAEKSTPDHKTVAPDKAYAPNMPDPLVNFEAIHNTYGVQPPDTQGDVGPNNYVQWVNLGFAIWDKAGNLLYGPANGNTLWNGLGGACEDTNDGDPITLYDPLADRWFMSQFALPNYPNGPFFQCIAISQSSDPTGAWYRYAYQMPVNKMNDYPKFGVWPDAYYMTVNQFNGGSGSWGGLGVAAFERQQMLLGNPAARMIYIDVGGVTLDYGGALPADLDGPPNGLQPPANAPGLFIEWDDSTWLGDPTDMLRIWEFHVDWTTPANSTFGANANFGPNVMIPTDNVDPDMCGGARNCIPQPGTSNGLDAIADRLMFRLQYRNLGGYQTLVSNHTVDVGSDTAGIHWFELRNTGSVWGMYQQGVFGPDADNRWMGSAALDHSGNLAVGYSISSSSTYPSIRYTGRLVGDPLGTLAQGEATLVTGTGSQTSFSNRWGDYSMLGVDPTDDCTFWYTQEYYQANGSDWRTRVGSFKFPSCSIGPTGTLNGTVTNSSNTNPINGAQVTATSSPTQTFGTTTGGAGTYEMIIPTGMYTVTASAFGFLPTTVNGVDVLSGTVTTQNFALDPAASSVVAGTVTDANTGWPLYASVTVEGYPGDPVWTDPETGDYSIILPNGNYTFDVAAFYPGYLPVSAAVSVAGPTTQDFALDVDVATCNAPGYVLNVSGGIDQDFETWPPPGWSIVDNVGGLVWDLDTAYGDTNYTSGVGHAADVNSDANAYVPYDTELRTPVFDLSAIAVQTLTYRLNYQDITTLDALDVDISVNGGSTWTNLRHFTTDQGSLYATPGVQDSIDLSAYGAETDVVLRWHYYTSDTSPWDWYAQIDEVRLGGTSVLDCSPQDGGLVVGNVYDANTSLPLVGANVASDEGASFTTIATPLDPAVDDGFYYLFATTGAHDVTASLGAYQASVATVPVPHYDVIRQDFDLTAGWLTYDPGALDVNLTIGTAATQTLTLINLGGASASFELKELDKGVQPLGPFEQPENGVVKPFRQNFKTAQGINVPRPLPGAAPLAAGDVIQSWVPTGNSSPWGIAFDGSDNTVWVGEGWGTNQIFEYGLDGTPTGRSYPYTWGPLNGPADAAFNYNTGMVWSLDVGGDDCIHEIDPASGVTGNTVCPSFSISQRGLAYDPSTDTWYAGGWNDAMVYHFDSAGGMLATYNTGLSISGLAYNPDTQHLFVMVNSDPNPVYVLDAANNMALVGQFTISAGFGAYAGAGLEFDCDGNLWAVDQASATVYQFESGETTSMCSMDVPWLSESPITGTLGHTGPLSPAPALTGGDVNRTPVTVDRSQYANSGLLSKQNPQVAVMDSSFEAGSPNPYWEEYSLHFGTPLCDPGFCGTGGGTAGPHTGDWWAWFGGSSIGDLGILTQTVVIPTYASFLNLYYWIGFAAASPTDNFRVLVDGNVLFTTPVNVITAGYQELNLDITAYADGLPHAIRLDSVTTGLGNTSVDDVSLRGTNMQDITVGFDASGITQPGIYLAQLKIANDTPYVVPNIPVTMTVTAPTWGKLNGTVTGLGYCDSDPAPLKDAKVVIVGASDTYTVTTDADGYYQWWFDASQSPVSVHVMADGHTDGNSNGVVVTAGQTTTQNFDLRWLEPCVTSATQSMEVTLVVGYSTTLQLSLENGGAEGTDFRWAEQDIGVIPPIIPPSDGKFARGKGAPSFGRAPITGKGVPAVAVELPSGNTAYAVEASNSYFTAFDLDVPEVLPNISSFSSADFPGAGTYANGSVYVLDVANNLYQLDPDTGAVLSTITVNAPPGGETYTGLAVDPTSGEVFAASCNITTSSLFSIDLDSGVATRIGEITNAPCAIDLAIDGSGQAYTYDIVNDMFLAVDLATGAGTVIGSIGFDANFGQGMGWDPQSDQIYLAAFNGATFQAELRVADTSTGNTVLIGVLGATTPGGTTQLPFLAIPVSTGFVDKVPWVSEAPITGTLSADGSQIINVTFDASVPEVIYYGSYKAILSVKTDDPINPKVSIPVTMTVIAPSYGVALTPETNALSASSGDTVTYTLHVTNTGNLPNTFTIAYSGNGWDVDLPVEVVTLDAGESTDVIVHVMIPAGTLPGSHDDVNITITGAGGANAWAALTTSAKGYQIFLPIIVTAP